jgi:2-methylisocitrate lyase-like PEP mutase family enzyme
MNETLRARLRQRFQEPGLVVAPGVFDMVSLRLADSFGFDALYMTGYGTVASHMGLPDAGLATLWPSTSGWLQLWRWWKAPILFAAAELQ